MKKTVKKELFMARNKCKTENEHLKGLVVWYVDTPWWKRLFRKK
jgi:hypothetical protein